MNTPRPLPFTRLVLIVSGVVQAVMALAGFVAPDFTGTVLSPAPQPPTVAIYYVAGFSLRVRSVRSMRSGKTNGLPHVPIWRARLS